MAHGVLALAILCAGCSSSGSDSKPRDEVVGEPAATDDTATDTVDCAERVNVMRRRFKSVAPVGIEEHLGPGAATPPLANTAETEWSDGLRLTVDDAEVRLDGTAVELSDLERRLELNARLDVGTQLPEKVPIYIEADGELPVRRLRTVVVALPETFTARLVVAVPDTRELPYAELSERVTKQVAPVKAATDPSRRATLLAETMQSAITGCADLITTFGRVAGMPAAKKGEYITRSSPDAIESCQCRGVDIDLFEALMLLALDAGPPRGWIPLDPKKLRRGTVAELAAKR